MFSRLPETPQMPRYQTRDRFENDPRPNKINIVTGVYKNSSGECTILPCVKEAEKRIWERETTKAYSDFCGSQDFCDSIQDLLLSQCSLPEDHAAVTVQTPGGTAALRLAGEFIKRHFPTSRMWVSEPTWGNHHAVFTAAGLDVKTYPYSIDEGGELQFESMQQVLLREVSPCDFVLLHGSCHNPTGVDLWPLQWQTIAKLAKDRGFMPLVDIAFLGFKHGVHEDLVRVKVLAEAGCDCMVALSLSKCFNLYNERAGSLSILARSKESAENTRRIMQTIVRASYSNPPAHGAAIVQTILTDHDLRTSWEDELQQIRLRIRHMRQRFVHLMQDLGVPVVNGTAILKQCGIFVATGLTREQVQQLEEQSAIYLPSSGHINVVAMTEEEMMRICQAISKLAL